MNTILMDGVKRMHCEHHHPVGRKRKVSVNLGHLFIRSS